MNLYRKHAHVVGWVLDAVRVTLIVACIGVLGVNAWIDAGL